jgi:hypothetical protein
MHDYVGPLVLAVSQGGMVRKRVSSSDSGTLNFWATYPNPIILVGRCITTCHHRMAWIFCSPRVPISIYGLAGLLTFRLRASEVA